MPDGLAAGNGKRLTARRAVEYHLWIDVGIIQHVGSESDPLIAQLLLLADLMYLFMLGMKLPDPLSAYSIGNATNEPPYDPREAGAGHRVSEAVMTFRYQAAITLAGVLEHARRTTPSE